MFILLIYRDPRRWDALSAAERAAAAREHDEFQRSVPEMAFVETLTEPTETTTVRVRAGRVTATNAPYLETPAFLCGYYLVDCEVRERAIELAAALPDARYAAVEVRELTYQFGTGFP